MFVYFAIETPFHGARQEKAHMSFIMANNNKPNIGANSSKGVKMNFNSFIKCMMKTSTVIYHIVERDAAG